MGAECAIRESLKRPVLPLSSQASLAVGGTDCEWDWQVMGFEGKMGIGGAWGKRMQRRGWQRSGSAIAQLEEDLEFSLSPLKRQAFNVSHYEEDLLSSASSAAARSDRCAPKKWGACCREVRNHVERLCGR